MTGRNVCHCGAQVVTARNPAGLIALDWPHAEHGDWAAEHTVSGAWLARYLPVGEPVTATEKRYRAHACGQPPQDLSEPVRATEPLRGEAFAAAVRQVKAEQARAERNRRGRRPGKAAVAIERPGMIRINPKGTNG